MTGSAVEGTTRIQARNRQAILEAGLDVFSQHGFRGATLDQIAGEAGLSKPNVLYYFASKEAIYAALLERLLDTWLAPLAALDPDGEPEDEILGYVRRKLVMSRDYPRESRLFANEILQGAPRIGEILGTDLRVMVDDKAAVIRGWAADGKIADVEPHHLIFSIWALTQHYADYDVQVRAVLGGADPFPQAEAFLVHLYRRTIAPGPPSGRERT
ncbi:TetR family transcriptional regulator C-terminal domain-containing protein [Wenxinia marina]|uniref:Transcriptional regulator, TetR family n=1 Tax=Wenxinia marina DSM 24838 TaxID=1123501 RepID=A0A0D0Q4E3_9RHOB|nr:TetR family transcriptional regulator C-terminal domain-containing protein [Wenxinia marina]KIQ67437.1 transcriptional regulator, TetR family [Wenxinia marina DSM 24838]GGL69522.1 TetR family transcriptional regulator [Wenxinia marina]